jgi:hypothetical protein
MWGLGTVAVIEELMKFHIQVLPRAKFYSLCAAFPKIDLNFMFLRSNIFL